MKLIDVFKVLVQLKDDKPQTTEELMAALSNMMPPQEIREFLNRQLSEVLKETTIGDLIDFARIADEADE